ncbi:hypothetical protein FEM48_Zijuj05G0051600 [Ziziphus jujuba var. spinosa]|uniref:Uncharacterized protein n=1 Tax=Ziziphus jujuba var. spinosa TaxID=714518 RepID=A0A978VD02_ZIZJJ|nr:hypothetical protein FEM48_Zijuj05G0051600 [Ziziphus jujuba var. spinosa]
MGCKKISMGFVILISWASWVHSSTPERSTIRGLFSACSTFITYGSPDPLPGSPCCDAMYRQSYYKVKILRFSLCPNS